MTEGVRISPLLNSGVATDGENSLLRLSGATVVDAHGSSFGDRVGQKAGTEREGKEVRVELGGVGRASPRHGLRGARGRDRGLVFPLCLYSSSSPVVG